MHCAQYDDHMKTISLRIDEDVKARWDILASKHGLNQSHLMREAILDKLEELEDFYVIQARLRAPSVSVSNDEVWKRLAIED